MAHEVEIRLLGGFDVRVGGVVVPWRGRLAPALVKLLALAPCRTLHREQVLDALWPDDDPVVAAPRLHKVAHFARRAMGRRDAVVLAGERVSLLPGVDVVVDAVLVESTAGDAEAVLAACTGDLLPGDPYEPWLEAPRAHLRRLRLDALRATGRWTELLAVEPTDEAAHVALMREHLAAGRRAAALRQYAALRALLRDELGVSPGPEAEELRQTALPAPAAPAVPSPSWRSCSGRGSSGGRARGRRPAGSASGCRARRWQPAATSPTTSPPS